jgi:uncharacterized membrane protein YeaQ/YmgE (transglycosylase-associated protein family)
LEKSINPFIWCAIGAAIGWLSTRMMQTPTQTSVVENVLVGMFGAFIGGDFVAAQFNGGVVATTFTLSGFVMAVAGAIVILLLLRLMRRIVGPMRNSKPTNRKRDY